MPLFKRYQNVDAAVINLLKFLKVNIDPEKISSELEKHPDYPSMLAISDVLANFKIENSAYRVDEDKIDIVPLPFLAHLITGGGEFVAVNRIGDGKIYFTDEKKRNNSLTLAEFKKVFAGVVLTAEPLTKVNDNKTFSFLLYTVKTPLVTAGLLLVIAGLLFNGGYFFNLNWLAALLSVIKTTGLAVSVLLLIQSVDSNNPLVQVLCGGGGKTDCNAILSSKAARAFGVTWLSWSEVGFFYFAGTWLLLFFGGASSLTVLILALLNLVSLPYTVYSLYYQAKVAKKWCVLCSTVQALLWLEFFPLAYLFTNGGRTFDTAFTPANLVTAFTCLLSPVLLWIVIKPYILKLQQLRPLKEQLRKFKYNAELFNRNLAAQPRYAQPDGEWSIILGNAEGANIVTMVSNPYCPPCSKMHKLLDELIEHNSEVQARIVFTADNTETDHKTPVARHLMALQQQAGKNVLKQAMHDWYEQKQKDYKTWAKAYPVQLVETDYYKLDEQKAWCSMAEIIATPTMLINGYKLPEVYQLPDLKYILQ